MEPEESSKLINKVLIFLVAILIIIAIFSLLQSYMVIHPPRRDITSTPSDYDLPYEAVSFESDGLELKGWLIPNNLSRSLVIVCHGHGSNKQEVLFAAKFLYDRGYDILLFDFRAHGESEGDRATLGWLETNDLKAAINYSKSRLDPESIGVLGYSMGGATAITTAGQTSDIKAVVTDSAFTDRFKLVSKVLHIPPPLSYMIPLFAELQDMNMRENLPIDYVDRISPSALFIIQGDEDYLVDVEDAQSLYDLAKSPKEIWLPKNTPHVGAYRTQGIVYEIKVISFFNKYL